MTGTQFLAFNSPDRLPLIPSEPTPDAPRKKRPVADAKEVGVGNPAEETFCQPSTLIFAWSPQPSQPISDTSSLFLPAGRDNYFISPSRSDKKKWGLCQLCPAQARIHPQFATRGKCGINASATIGLAVGTVTSSRGPGVWPPNPSKWGCHRPGPFRSCR
jgi:hypothetical protein